MNRPTRSQTALPQSIRLLVYVPGKGSLVFMPDFGVNALYARPLVAELVGECSCYAAQIAPQVVANLPGLSIEDIGRRFAEAIDAAQLPRPLHILGFSFAGVLAYETSRQLALRKAAPDQVWLLDISRYRPFSLSDLLHRPVSHAIMLFQYLKANWRRFLLGRKEPDVLSAYGVIRMDLRSHPESYREIIRCNYDALLHYVPQPASAATVLMRAMQGSRYNEERGGGWEELVSGPFEVIDVPGDHLSMLREVANARVVAQNIRERLAQAPRPGRG